MTRMLLRKYVGEAWLLWLACAIALFAFAWVRVWIASLFEFTEVRDILDRFRRFERFSPVPFDQLASYEGRVGISFDEPVVLLCIAVWSIARGSDVVSGELGRGTLEMLLGQPISRWRLLCTHAAVTVTGLIALVLLHWAGLWCGIQTNSVSEAAERPQVVIPWIDVSVPLQWSEPEVYEVPFTERVDPAIFAAASVNLFCFGFLLFGLAVGLSCVDRFRWRTVGLSVGIHVVQLVFFGLSRATDRLHSLKYATYVSCYRPQELTQLIVREGDWFAPWRLVDPVDGGLGPGCFSLCLFLLGALLWLGGSYYFVRRDLPAPL